MKLHMCLECMDVFSLSHKEKVCGCGNTKGRYIDNLNAEYSGNAQPIGFANGSFRQSFQLQKIEDKTPKRKNECCKGVEFTAFFIPKSATSLTKTDD